MKAQTDCTPEPLDLRIPNDVPNLPGGAVSEAAWAQQAREAHAEYARQRGQMTAEEQLADFIRHHSGEPFVL